MSKIFKQNLNHFMKIGMYRQALKNLNLKNEGRISG